MRTVSNPSRHEHPPCVIHPTRGQASAGQRHYAAIVCSAAEPMDLGEGPAETVLRLSSGLIVLLGLVGGGGFGLAEVGGGLGFFEVGGGLGLMADGG